MESVKIGRFSCTVIEPDIVKKKMGNKKPTLIVLYGSEGGTAEEYAERVTRESLCFDMKPVLCSMNSYLNNWKALVEAQEEFITCFVCSTTGQGDMPENMKLFWKHLLRKNLNADYLSNVQFTVLGLGDSSYAKYNFVGKKLYKRLLQLGGEALTELYLADDQHDLGPDAVVNPWLNTFWLKLFPNARVDTQGAVILEISVLQPKFFALRDSGYEPSGLPDTPHDLEVPLVPLVQKERVTDLKHFQDVQLFTFDIGDSSIKYRPGDVLVVQPTNLQENISLFYEIFARFQDSAEDRFYIVPNTERPWATIPPVMRKLYPQPWSLDFILKYYFDLQVVPKRHVFELLAFFTTSDLEREKLQEFCSPEGQQDLFAYCNRPRRTILEVLQDFPHAVENITEDYLFDLFTPIKPRSFSIASSMRQASNLVQILVAVVEYQTRLKKPRLGLCSNFLKRLQIGDHVPVWIQSGSFKFPSVDEIPVIMVGPGTGCAPFHSLIAEKHGIIDEMILFFGCRNESKDFFFKKEWTELKNKDELKLFTAFSRDSLDGSKVYVQHLIEAAGDLIWETIEKNNGMIFIAGNAKQMPNDVRNAFLDVFKKYGRLNDPTEYMDELVKSNRYQTEVWS